MSCGFGLCGTVSECHDCGRAPGKTPDARTVQRCGDEILAALASHPEPTRYGDGTASFVHPEPAPVAAHWEVRGAGVTLVGGTGGTPVAAPCAGCAELKERERELLAANDKLDQEWHEELDRTHAVTVDRNEWRAQQENLLMMYRDSEARTHALRQAIGAAIVELDRFGAGMPQPAFRALSALKAARGVT